jgi:hypothetical protein
MGLRTNPELKRFGRKVVFPVDYRMRENIEFEKIVNRDEQLRQIYEN